MKKLFSILFLIILYFNGVGQSVVPRSNSSITVQDSRWQAQYNLFTPRYADTTAANLQKGIDSLGAIIYTYDVQSFWGRQYSSGKKWVALGSGGGGGSGTVTNIATGLGLSGGPITTTGTLLVDTASASILSRQRAAATYALIGAVANPFLPVSGTGTATGSIIGDLSGNTLQIQQGGESFLQFVPTAGSELSSIRAFNSTGGDNTSAGTFFTSNGDAQFLLQSNFDGATKSLSIAGFADATTSTLTYTADTHTFNVPVLNGAFSVTTDGSNGINFVSRTGLSAQVSDPTGDIKSGFQFNIGASNSDFDLFLYVDDNKAAYITGHAQSGLSEIEYEADTHTFNGVVIPGTDNTYALGDATHRWSALHVMGSSIKMYGSSSGVVTIGTPAAAGTFNFNLPITAGTSGQVLTSAGGGASAMTWTTPTTGTVTSVAQSFTGGLISVGGSPITGSGTLALTVAGTSGGIPYFSSSSAWASSAALAANALVIGGGAGVAPSTTTTATGMLTFLGTPSSANLRSTLTDETGTGVAVFATAPSMSSITYAAGTATAGTAPAYYTAGTNLTVPVSGAKEFDGNTFYFTTASGRGFANSTMFARQTADFTGQNVNTVQPVFETGFDVWTLQASTSYYFEGFYSFSHGSTGHSVGLSFELAGGASITSISYTTTAWVTAIGTNTASQTTNIVQVATNVAMNASGANATEQVYFSGYISMNAGGTVTPSYTFSVAPGTTVLTKAGSYIRFTPFGSNTVNSLGNVN